MKVSNLLNNRGFCRDIIITDSFASCKCMRFWYVLKMYRTVNIFNVTKFLFFAIMELSQCLCRNCETITAKTKYKYSNVY